MPPSVKSGTIVVAHYPQMPPSVKTGTILVAHYPLMPPSVEMGTLLVAHYPQMPPSVNDSKQSLYHVTYRTISLQLHHAGTFDFLTFPTGHEESTPPIGGDSSDARFAFSSEIDLSRAWSTATPGSRQFFEAATILTSSFTRGINMSYGL
jgi:hypothetical protein